MISLKNIIREILLDLISLLGNLFFLFSKKPKIEPEKIKKILIVKLYALGDIVYAEPMVPNLRANFPNAKIVWLVQRYSRTVVEHIVGVDEIIEWQGVARTLKILKAKKFDLAFSTYRSSFAHLLLWLAHIPIRVGFAWRGRGFSLTHKIKFCDDIIESDRYLKLIEDLGLPIKIRRRSLSVSEEKKSAAAKAMADKGVNLDYHPIVGIFAGGGDNPQLLMTMKRWSTERLAKVADYLVEKKQAQVVILGSPSEKSIADQVAKSAKVKILKLAGKIKLENLVAAISLFDLLIAVDTGPLHIACALDVPTIGLFGPTDPNLLVQAGPKNLIIRKDSNPPIYRPNRVFLRNYAGLSSDPVHPSMLAIEAQDVIKAIDKIL